MKIWFILVLGLGTLITTVLNINQKIKKGQALMKFDKKSIMAAGYLITTPVLVTNSFEYSDVKTAPFGDVKVV